MKLRQCSLAASLFLFTACLSPCLPAADEDVTQLQMSRLLFEPRPLPADGALDDPAFVSLADATVQQDGTENVPSSAPREEAATLRASIAEYLARIGDKEAEEGPYSDQLTQDLLSTGQIHQQLGAHEQAIDFFLRAQNISRANHGFEDIDQAPIMEAMSQSYLALGKLSDADAAQDGLLYLHQKAYGDSAPQTVAALHRVGDWNVDAFLTRSNIMLNIKRVNMANFFETTGYSGGAQRSADVGAYVQDDNPMNTPLFKLYLAQTHYQSAINALLQAKDYTNPDLLELERKLIKTLFLHTHQENIVYEPDFYLNRSAKATGTRVDVSAKHLLDSVDYAPGVESLKRSLTYIVNNEQRTAEQVAHAMLEAGDWELLFMRSRRADDKYEEAYGFFADNPAVTATISHIVYPPVPVVLPVFLPAPNSREKLGIAAEESVNYVGYFDVTLGIGKNGKARRVKFIGQGGEVTQDMELRLGDYLKNLVFRPRYKDGEYDDSELRLRYYVAY